MASIAPILKQRLDDPSEEIERLTHLIGKEEIPQWLKPEYYTPQLLNEQYMVPFGLRARLPSPRVSMVFLQAIAIQKAVAQTHDTFFHGQSSRVWGVVPLILNEAQKKAGLKASRFKLLRTPALPNLANLTRYQSGDPLFPNNPELNDHAPEVQKDLIPVTASLDGSRGSEAPLWYVESDTNVDRNGVSISNACKKALAHFYPFLPFFIVSKLAEKIQRVYQTLLEPIQKEYGAYGNLFVICIPKELRDQGILYRSHPRGIACKCDPTLDEGALLEALRTNQKVIVPKCSKIPSDPQYRLYAPHLTPDKGIFSVQCSPYPKHVRKQLKLEVQKILRVVDDYLDGFVSTLPPPDRTFAHQFTTTFLLLKKQSTCPTQDSLIVSSAALILSFL